MLDRKVVKDFLEGQFEDFIEIPKDINLEELVEDFSQYTEDDTYEWLKDNFRSYFFSNGVGRFRWDDVREKLKE